MGQEDKFFKKNEEGKYLFFPWGAFGQGYLVEDENSKKQIFKSVQKFRKLSFLGLILFAIAGKAIVYFLEIELPTENTDGRYGRFSIKFWYGIIAGIILYIPVFLFLYSRWVKKNIKGLFKTYEKNPILEKLKEKSKAEKLSKLIMLELVCLVIFFWSGLSLIKGEQTFVNISMGLLGIVFFGIGAGIFGYQIFLKIKKK